MTGGESQRIISTLTACLNWVHHLSCTAGDHLKEMEGTGSYSYGTYYWLFAWKNIRPSRGISLLVITYDGAQYLHPASINPFGLGEIDIVIKYLPPISLFWAELNPEF